MKAAQASLDLAQAQQQLAQKHVDFAKARQEQVEYQALRDSGDPAWQKISVGAIAQRLERAQDDVRKAESDVASRRATRDQAMQQLQMARSGAQAGFQEGVGGAGVNGNAGVNSSGLDPDLRSPESRVEHDRQIQQQLEPSQSTEPNLGR